MTAESRRDQLIQVAVDLFSRNGYVGTTTKSIAAEAGVSEAIIFRHFSTKEDLYAAILDYKANQAGVEEWLLGVRDAADRGDDEALFRSFSERILESYRRDPYFQRLMFYSSLEGHAFAKVFQKRRGLPIFDFLRDYVARRQKEGALGDFDPGVIVFALIGMSTYYAIVRRLFGMELLKASDAKVTNTFTKLLLDGLRNGHPAHNSNKQ